MDFQPCQLDQFLIILDGLRILDQVQIIVEVQFFLKLRAKCFIPRRVLLEHVDDFFPIAVFSFFHLQFFGLYLKIKTPLPSLEINICSLFFIFFNLFIRYIILAVLIMVLAEHVEARRFNCFKSLFLCEAVIAVV